MSYHRLIVGHVLDALRTLPDESVHAVCTSPPYWGLRDYGLPPAAWPEAEYAPMPGLPPVKLPAWEGQLGLEPTPEMYVGHLVLVFREVRRVLRRDGTHWLNLGDSYARDARKGQHRPGDSGKQAYIYDRGGGRAAATADLGRGLKGKDLVGIPWRVAFALQADGWWLRSDIVWQKTNSLPESVKDRPTKVHEYVFLLAKSERYCYDPLAVAEPAAESSLARVGQPTFWLQRGGEKDYRSDDVNPNRSARKAPEDFAWSGSALRNRRSVWQISTEPFPGAHFAVFPRKLAELCILAGTSPFACPACGAPWARVTEKTGQVNRREPAHVPGNSVTKTDSTGWAPTARATDRFEPSCPCPGNDGSGSCVVLDPFGGAGTTALAADGLGRDSVYVDLKREYAEMALRRLGAGERLFVRCELVDLAAATNDAAEAG